MVRVVRATQVEIETAVQALRDGELVAFPTETVYGLGANAQNPAAVRKIFEAKGRPTTHPVIVHLDSPRFLHRWVQGADIKECLTAGNEAGALSTTRAGGTEAFRARLQKSDAGI